MNFRIKSLIVICAIAILGSGLALAGDAGDRAPFAVHERAGRLAAETGIGAADCNRIVALLEQGETRTRRQAAYVLGEWGSSRAVTPLLNCLNSRDEVLRRVAAAALGKLQSLEAVESLIELAVTVDQPAPVRRAALTALGRIGDPRAVGHLEKLARSDDGEIRFAANLALRQLQLRGYN